ncbi:glutaminyl-peptide cyclotransferase [Vagococcus fluvialis]|uniref:glutaminyl-peptide cyclotransferase n=1 Tax=Vagococcus fluvialis TaxID=2738 RepID=UPI0037BBA837
MFFLTFLFFKKDYKILEEYPYDESIFTQGLVLYNQELFVSSGEYGKSFIAKIDLENGKIYEKLIVENNFFSEGITIIDNQIFQLTWKENVVNLYNSNTYKKKGSYYYEGEGWGITNSKEYIYMSDGTNQLIMRNINNFKKEKTIFVKHNQQPVYLINELEYVDGYIYANVWKSDLIYKIDANSGEVVKTFDLSNLFNDSEKKQIGVLNGIAHITKKDFYITGKNWNKLFKIRLE